MGSYSTDDRQTRECYLSAYEESPSSILCGICKYQNDEDLTLVYANEFFYNIFGYENGKEAKKEGFIGIRHVIAPVARESFFRDLKECMDYKNKSLETENLEITKDGRYIWVRIRCSYEEGDDTFCASFVDITEKKAREEEIRIKEEDYRIAVSMADKEILTYDINKHTAMHSMGSVDVLKVPSELDNFPDSLIERGIVAPESVESLKKFFAKMDNGEPSGHEVFEFFIADEKQKRWFLSEFKMVYTRYHEAMHAIISFSDITERRENEIAYKRIVNAMSVIDEEKRITYECNLNKLKLEREIGNAMPHIGERFSGNLTKVIKFIQRFFVYPEDKQDFAKFVSVNRLLMCYKRGIYEDTTVIRGTDEFKEPVFMELKVELIEDPYTGDIKAFFEVHNVNELKRTQLMLQGDIEKLKKELEKSRIKVMMNQMQPHFLYNALSAIRAITRSDPEYAYNLLYDFSIHLRGSVKALSSDAPIPLSEEITNIKAYLNIEKMRFGDKLNIVYDIREDDFEVIPLTIQPLVENAVRHGIYQRGKKGGTVEIKSYEDSVDYVIEVNDNGVGFDREEVFKKKTDSVGLKSLMFRLKSLLGADVYINSVLNEGTSIKVKIPKDVLGDEDDEDLDHAG